MDLTRYFLVEVTMIQLNDAPITFGGVILACFGMGGFAGQLRSSVRTVWGHRRGELSLWAFLREKLWAMVFPLLIAFSAYLSQHARIRAVSDLGLHVREVLSPRLLIGEFLATGLYWGLFNSLLYKILAPAKLRWSDIVLGAFATSVLMAAGRYFVDRYLRSKGIGFNLAYVPQEFREKPGELFDKAYMKKLYDLGYFKATGGTAFQSELPGIETTPSKLAAGH